MHTTIRRPCTQIVLNDSGYGMIKWKQGTGGFPCYGLDYGNPNFVEYAASYGCRGHRVTTAAELPALLQRCLTEPAVHLIDVPISYNSSDLELNVELGNCARDASFVMSVSGHNVKLASFAVHHCCCS